MTSYKPKTAFTVDVDSFEMIIKSYGAKSPANLSTFEDMLEQTVNFFRDRGLRVTLFIAGVQVKSLRAKGLLREAHDSGFEIGNHTLNHLAHYHILPLDMCRYEISENDKLLSDITGSKIVGFRGPGWNWNDKVLDILIELEYRYTTNVIPSPMLVGITKIRSLLFQKNLPIKYRKVMGCFGGAFSQNRPHVVRQNGNKRLYELPVSVVYFLPMVATIHMMKIGRRMFHWQLGRRVWNYCSHGHDYYFPEDATREKLERISRDADYYLNPSFLRPEAERRAFAENVVSRLSDLYEITTGIDCVYSQLTGKR